MLSACVVGLGPVAQFGYAFGLSAIHAERTPALAAELIALKPDLLIASNPFRHR
jgi:hypothetical protein